MRRCRNRNIAIKTTSRLMECCRRTLVRFVACLVSYFYFDVSLFVFLSDAVIRPH